MDRRIAIIGDPCALDNRGEVCVGLAFDFCSILVFGRNSRQERIVLSIKFLRAHPSALRHSSNLHASTGNQGCSLTFSYSSGSIGGFP